MSNKSEIDKLVANLKPNAKLPRGIGFMSEKMLILFLKANQKRTKAK